MADVAQLKARFTAEGVESVVGGARRVDQALAQTAEHGNRMGKALTFAGGAITGAFGVVALRAIGGMASGAMQFSAQMANVNSIAQLSTDQLNQLGDSVLKISSDPRIAQAPAVLAAGLYDIESSGFKGADALNILQVSAMAATAGLTDTATASRAVDATLNAYGLTAASAGLNSDILFQTVQDGVLTFGELSNSLGSVLPTANSLNVGLDQVGAAMAQLTLGGISAEESQTSLNALLTSALSPTQALTDALAAHGYASASDIIQTQGLTGYLKFLNDASGGTAEGMFALTGDVRANKAAMALAKGDAKGYTDELKRMDHASDGVGATQKALAKQMESASYQFGQVRKQASILGTTVERYLEPTFAKFASGMAGKLASVTKFADGFLSRIDNLRHKGLSPLEATLKSLHRQLDTTFGKDVGDAVNNVLQGMDTAISAVGRTIRSVGGGVIDFGKALVTGDFSTVASDIWKLVKAAVGDVIDFGSWVLNVAAPKLGGWITDIGGDIWGWLKGQLGFGPIVGDATGIIPVDREFSLGEIAVAGMLKLGTGLAEIAGRFSDWLHEQIFGSTKKTIGYNVGTVHLTGTVETTGLVERVKNAIDGMQLPDLAGRFIQWINGLDTQSWGQAFGQKLQSLDWSNAASAMFEGLKAALNSKVGIAVLFFASLPALLVAGMIGIGAIMAVKGVEFIVGLLQGLTSGWSANIGPWLGGRPTAILADIGLLTATLLQAGTDLIVGLQAGIDAGYAGTVAWLRALPADVVAEIGDVSITLLQTGITIIQGFWNGLVAQWASVSAWFSARPEETVLEIGDVSMTLWSTGAVLIAGMWDGITSQWDAVSEWLGGIAGRIIGSVGYLGGILYGAGADAVQGLIDGAASRISGLQGVVNTLISIFNQIPRLGASPWPMMVAAGQDAVNGLVVGAQSRHRALAKTVGGISGTMQGMGGQPLGASYSGVSRASNAGIRASAPIAPITIVFGAGSFVGAGALKEINALIESGAGRVVDRRINARQVAGARA